MRILFNSKDQQDKSPFGTLTPGEACRVRIRIPCSCKTRTVTLVVEQENGASYRRVDCPRTAVEPPYESYGAEFSLADCGLYFYFFEICTEGSTFPLFKQGEDTNMCAGDKWQLSCVPADAALPDDTEGAVMYQIFPDRFYRSGVCDLQQKLGPYSIHAGWDETPVFAPDTQGIVQNNDFFGGNFQGIQQKLDYIQSLGVTILYLNPIFKAYSNHRYDTCDYKTTDPMLGTPEEFSQLCRSAHDRGMRVILDGVFSHTGSDSIYFDKLHRFGGGACEGPSSPYYSWYEFQHFPDRYTSWWGIDTLPCIRKLEPSYLDYIIRDEDSVVAHWLRLGADGFRLDVVDELPDEFLQLLRQRMRAVKPDALLIGEVWEDASNKIAYGRRRTYFTRQELDSVMNYPWQKAIIRYCSGWDDGSALRQSIETLQENYPPQVLARTMNFLSTHDTVRILTRLGDHFEGSKAEQAQRRLNPEQRLAAMRRLRVALCLQFVLPGMPSIYYGDEAGMEGYADPFNRRCYPWGQEDESLLAFTRALGMLRRDTPTLRRGALRVLQAGGGRVCLERSLGNERILLFCNLSRDIWELDHAGTLLLGSRMECAGARLALDEQGCCILRT